MRSSRYCLASHITDGLPIEIYVSWSGGSSFSLISKSLLYRHQMSLFSQTKGPAQGPASSLRSVFTAALCLPVSTWLNSTGSTRIFLSDTGPLDNCHCCPGVCDRYGYYGSHQMKLSQFLFPWRIKSLLCWQLVMVRRPQKVDILLSSDVLLGRLGARAKLHLSPRVQKARFILDDRSHWLGTVPPFGMVNGRVFPTPKVSAPVSWFGLGSQKLQLWPCLSDGNGCWLSHGWEVWVSLVILSNTTTSSIT